MKTFTVNLVGGFTDREYNSAMVNKEVSIDLWEAEGKTQGIKLLKKFLKSYCVRNKVSKGANFWLFDIFYTDGDFIENESTTLRISTGSDSYFIYHNGYTMEEYLTEVLERFAAYLLRSAEKYNTKQLNKWMDSMNDLEIVTEVHEWSQPEEKDVTLASYVWNPALKSIMYTATTAEVPNKKSTPVTKLFAEIMDILATRGIASQLIQEKDEIYLEWCDHSGTCATYTYRKTEKEAYFTSYNAGVKVKSKKFKTLDDFVTNCKTVL
jgi:hypothetical protein